MKILVIGDAILDKYVWGTIKRQSPEDSSIPIVDFVDEECRLGGALNVAANIKALSKRTFQIYVSSIISDYTATLLKDKKIFYDEIVLKTKESKSPHPRELIKTRIINSVNAKQIVRIDNREKFADSDIQRYKNKCYYSNFIDFDAIVVSDYDKGFVDESIIDKLEKVVCPVFIDTKKKDLSIWQDIEKCFVKINSKEYAASCESHKVQNLIVTDGEKGSTYYQNGLLNSSFRTDKVEEADVVGAGDSYLAAFVIASLEGKEIGDCLKFANKVASLSVTKFGTTIVERSEIK